MADPFQVQLGRVTGSVVQPVTQQAGNSATTSTQETASFQETLENVQRVRFSNHAQSRLQSREINLNSDNVNRLSDAIDKAEKRGGRSSLVVVDDLAFIVNVQNRTVITALDKNQRGEGVFTQIDSVVFADPANDVQRPSIDVKG
ncbi:MAG TPA: TIGR02530 family flagellar biosynthesis protein [Anaerolineales bacterium]|nr:TIGR02530 family flagellar biosynthesis protein [Anaerolineales bacterium]HNO31522.1 TIGR02530 family flagellar biosynthesis protein [Anaerolineales bacterium]